MRSESLFSHYYPSGMSKVALYPSIDSLLGPLLFHIFRIKMWGEIYQRDISYFLFKIFILMTGRIIIVVYKEKILSKNLAF